MSITASLLRLAVAGTLGSLLAIAQGPTPLVTRSQQQNLEVLKSDAPRKAKADACRELAVIGGPEAVPTLVSLLASPELNHMARYALETMPAPAVSEALRGQLNTLRGRPLVGVIGTLGVRRDVQAVPHLAGFLDSTDGEVVRAAARALGRLGTLDALQPLMDGVSRANPEDLPAFVEGLGRAADILVAAGRTQEVLPLMDAYTDTSLPHQVRAAALRAAILARGANGVPLLREVLGDAEYVLFAAAVQVSFEVPGSPVTEVLAAALPSQPTADRQVVILGALGERGDRKAVPTILTATSSPTKAVQVAAVKALGMLPGDDLIPTYVALLKNPGREVAQAAREGLASLPGPAANAAILKLLDGTPSADQLVGIELVGRRRITDATPALLTAAGRGEPPVRAAALKQLGELGTDADIPAVLDLLLKATDDPGRDGAGEALTAIAARGRDTAAVGTRVIDALAVAPAPAKPALLEILASLGGPGALKAVQACSADSAADVRNAAIRALSAWKTADAAPALLELATRAGTDTDRRLALGGYLALARNTDLPAGQRLEMCRNAAPLVQRTEDQKQVLGALGLIPSPDAFRMAASHLDDPATRTEAAAALVAIADPLIRGQVTPELAKSVAETLGRLAATVPNADLARKARNLAEQATKKAGP